MKRAALVVATAQFDQRGSTLAGHLLPFLAQRSNPLLAEPSELMQPALRTYFVNELIGAIQTINPQFEAFGTRVADFLVDVPLQHRGLNELGAPVPHTVDSVSNDGSVVCEYSARADYFAKPYSKIRDDFVHARQLHPAVRRLYLFSRLDAGETAHTRLINFARHTKNLAGIEVQVYDARRLALFIVDRLLHNNLALNALEPFLAPLARIRSTYIATHRVPDEPPQFVARAELERDILERLERETVVAIAGLSGIGKSELAAAVARAAQARYDAVVWAPDALVQRPADLEGVVIDQNGVRANLRHLLKEYRTLVVLDNLQTEAGELDLRPACAPGSAILITRQVAQVNDHRAPALDKPQARLLLERFGGSRCPDDVFDEVYRVAGGFPLALKLIGNFAEEESWGDVAETLEGLGDMTDQQQGQLQTLADRVIGRLQPVLRNELDFLRWCGTSRVDREFARRAVTVAGVRRIEKTGLLASDHLGTLRIHDIVMASLDAMAPPVPERAEAFAGRLADHISTVVQTGSEEFDFLNVGHVHRALLARLARANPERPEYLYCLLHVWNPREFDGALAGDPVARARAIAESGAEAPDVAVNTVLEVIDAAWRYEKAMLGHADARQRLTERLEAYTVLEGAGTLSVQARRDVRHQHAKALSKLRRDDEAVAICEEILNAPSLNAATQLLLARLLVKRAQDGDTLRAKDLIVSILEQAEAGVPGLGRSTLLAAISEVVREPLETWALEITDRFWGTIKGSLVESAARGLPQGLQALAAVARYYGWNAPERLAEVVAQIPLLFEAGALGDEERAYWGDIHLAAALAVDGEDAQVHREHALRFYEALEHPQAFQQQQRARALFELGRADEASALLEALLQGDRWGFAKYWLSRVRLAQGDPGAAMDLLDGALALLSEGSRYRPTFLEQRYQIRTTLGDDGAAADLRDAYNLLPPGRHKTRLREELAELEG